MPRKKTQKKKDLELLTKCCPAVFGGLPPNENTPRYVAFTLPPKIFWPIQKWLDLGFSLEVATGSRKGTCQVYIINTQAVHEYNKGRDPKIGYQKE